MKHEPAMKHELLTADEEHSLIEQAQAGDTAARNRLIECNLRFIRRIVTTLLRPGFDRDDLEQAGALGLITAIRRFDLSQGRLTTYARWWIYSYVQRYMRHARCVHVPEYLVCGLSAWLAAENRLTGEIGSPPSLREIGRACGLKWEKAKKMHRAARAEEPVSGAHAAPPSWIGGADADERAHVRATLRRVPDARIRRVLEGRFYEGKTLEAVAAELGVCRERVRQLERDGLAAMREML